MPRITVTYPRQWRKLHLAIDAQTGEIVAHVLTDKDVGDIGAVPALLATVEGPIARVIADGAYDGASVYKAASLRQQDLLPAIVIPPRASSVINEEHADTSTARDRHVHCIAEKGCMAWQKATNMIVAVSRKPRSAATSVSMRRRPQQVD